VLDGLKRILKLRDFYLLAFLFFVIYAIFNGISMLIDKLVSPRAWTPTRRA